MVKRKPDEGQISPGGLASEAGSKIERNINYVARCWLVANCDAVKPDSGTSRERLGQISAETSSLFVHPKKRQPKLVADIASWIIAVETETYPRQT